MLLEFLVQAIAALILRKPAELKGSGISVDFYSTLGQDSGSLLGFRALGFRLKVQGWVL